MLLFTLHTCISFFWQTLHKNRCYSLYFLLKDSYASLVQYFFLYQLDIYIEIQACAWYNFMVCFHWNKHSGSWFCLTNHHTCKHHMFIFLERFQVEQFVFTGQFNGPLWSSSFWHYWGKTSVQKSGPHNCQNLYL